MHLYQLEQFCTIARHEHISRAAQELFVSQPTLSLNLARLESELGVPLFDRVGRNIKLNHYGKLFYVHVDRALTELETARQAIADLQSDTSTPTVFADALFNDTFSILQDFLIVRPEAKVIHLVLTIPEILLKLESGDLDFGIIIAPTDYSFGSNFNWQPLWETELMALAPETHPLAQKGVARLSELKDDEFVCAINGFDSRDAFDHYCKLAGIVPNYRYTSIKPYLFNDLTRKYGSISIMSQIMYDCHDIPRKDLIGLRTDMTGIVALTLTEPQCVVQFGIITYKHKYLGRSAQTLIDYVSQYFEKNKGLF